METEKNSKPLNRPRKKTIFFVVIIIVVTVAVLLLFFSEKENFNKNGSELGLNTTGPEIKDLIKTDTDKDGILDWEEALWGTDKNKTETFGMPDLKYVEQKKQALDIEQIQNDKTLNETEIFAQEFFATYTAMKNSGQGNESVNAFSNLLGQKIGDPTLGDVYKESQIKISKVDTLDSRLSYYIKLENLFNKYVEFGIGDEVEIVNSGLISYTEKGQNADYSALVTIGEAYKNFAEDVVGIEVPKTLVESHLKIINSAHNTGVSVGNMTKAIEDPIIGIGGVTQYEKYSNELYTAVGELEDFILNSGE